MIYKKKTWPDYFQNLLDGSKKFDCRIADFDPKIGDIIIFEEFDPNTKQYTGRTLNKKISYIGKTKDWTFFKQEDIDKFGYLILSLN